MTDSLTAPTLELCDVSKVFATSNGRRHVLTDISLSVHPGEILWLRGESGSGKSSVVRVGALLSTPTTGFVRVNGTRVDPKDGPRLRREYIGIVFQNGNLLPELSLRDNVAIAARRPDYIEVDALISKFGLSDAASTKGKEASGGQAQRTALCRALLNDPKVLLADEPTASLDTQNARYVLEQISSAAALGAGALLTSHDNSCAEIATRTLELVGGKVV